MIRITNSFLDCHRFHQQYVIAIIAFDQIINDVVVDVFDIFFVKLKILIEKNNFVNQSDFAMCFEMIH